MFSRLSLITILCATALVAVGELAVGTRPEFVLAVIVIFVCAGLTFNMLEGLTSLAGILFAELALRTIVISQFVKVVLFERADQNLEVPSLTITLYAIFFFCVMLSIFVFGRFRVPVPKPLEPVSQSHARKLYIIAFIVGTIATVIWDAAKLSSIHNATRTLSNVLSGLLLFAVVLGVDQKVRNSSGRHSVGWDAALPILILQISSLITSSREAFLAPVLVYFVCAFTRGYRFQKRHLAFAAGFGLIFYFVVSPLFLYNRGQISGQDFSGSVQASLRTLAETKGRTSITTAREIREGDNANRLLYYSVPVSDVLSRLALVRPDSDLISAASGGYRYGWATIINDVLYGLPSAVYARKPERDAYAITGHVSGLNSEWEVDAETTVTGIADAYAAFGVLGVVLFGLFGIPAFLMVCRSAFDIQKPWGVVALGMTVVNFGEWLVGHTFIETIELPLMLFAISWFIGTLALLVPTRPDNFGNSARGLGITGENSTIVP